MHRGTDRRRGQRLQHEIAVGDRVQRIGHRVVEAERLRGRVAVDRKRRAGKGRGTQRRFIEPLARIRKAAAVARGHLDIGEQMMAERHRLRGLQMREARHHGCRMFARARHQRALETGQRRVQLVDGVADIEAEVGGDLVVARARGVQPSCRRTDQLAGSRFSTIHVNVLERALDVERSLLPDL